MASVFYILDGKGSPLIHRSYRGEIAQDVPVVFQRHVVEAEESNITPVFEEGGYTYTFIRENDVYLLLVSSINTCSLLQVAFLYRCVSVFQSFFRSVTEETVQDNFVIVYELLDEICDFGYPQFTEEKVLREYILQSTLLTQLLGTKTVYSNNELPAAVTGAASSTPWRMPLAYHYKRNSVFLDVVESVDLLVNQAGLTLSSEISGVVHMNCRLSGMPTVRVGLNDKIMLDMAGRRGLSVEVEDMRFHQCVKLNQFESERVISFIPPDGEFDLLSYRVSKTITPPVKLLCTVIRHGSSRVELGCSLSTSYRKKIVAHAIDVLIPIPSDADRPEARCSMGAVKYAPESNLLIWKLQNVPGQRTVNCQATFHLPSIRSSDATALSKAPIKVKFEIPYFVASGLQVRYVKVTERSNYNTTPWVRYLTQSGNYEVRTD